ncbi:unnamed protein product [Gongylonema pulchrum]|uniref:Pacifastin domain-containing protein n=1 Tax=Gongylonema pulchrum TaxID=637853 RepID=A0A183DWZ2_9BILA|nr:unnamed protein product [Gongylonema pulchrum]
MRSYLFTIIVEQVHTFTRLVLLPALEGAERHLKIDRAPAFQQKNGVNSEPLLVDDCCAECLRPKSAPFCRTNSECGKRTPIAAEGSFDEPLSEIVYCTGCPDEVLHCLSDLRLFYLHLYELFFCTSIC